MSEICPKCNQRPRTLTWSMEQGRKIWGAFCHTCHRRRTEMRDVKLLQLPNYIEMRDRRRKPHVKTKSNR